MSDYRYANLFKNNTFVLVLKQLCKMMTLTQIKWKNLNQNYLYLLCFYLPNTSPSQGIQTLRESAHAVRSTAHAQRNALHERTC